VGVVLRTSHHGRYKNNLTLHSTDGATEYLQCNTPDGSNTGLWCYWQKQQTPNKLVNLDILISEHRS